MIVRVAKRRRFTVIDNHGVEDSSLSYRALGLLTYLLSKPDEWRVSVEHLAAQHKEGREAVRGALHELENGGYVQRIQTRGEGGQFEWEHVIHETPQQATSAQEPADGLDLREHRETAGGTIPQETVGGKPGAGFPSHSKDGECNTEEQRLSSKRTGASGEAHPLVLISPPPKDDPAAVAFTEWWAVYPRRDDRKKALAAYRKALKATDVETLRVAAARYRDDPGRDPAFTKLAATWLNGECWTNGPLPRSDRRGTGTAGGLANLMFDDEGNMLR